MAISDERRRELLAAVGLDEAVTPVSAVGPTTTPTQSVPTQPLAPDPITPTQPQAQPGTVITPTQLKTPGRPTQSVTLSLREEAERTTPPGIRPEFAHKPLAKVRPGFGPALPPLREGEYRVDVELWERQREVAREVARDEWVRSRGHDPYARMHTSMRDD
jgi:hypothetical protein